jgi:acyl-CoA synthetase (AMP-forming)/AMP-acid ligase II
LAAGRNIVGRVKDMVIRGGENVYPREVEEFLFRHPKVQSAQVFGVPGSQVRRGSMRMDHSQAWRAVLGKRNTRFLPRSDRALHRILITTENTVEIEGQEKPALIANVLYMAVSE